MDLHLYPLDVQECPLIIESCKLQFIVGSLSSEDDEGSKNVAKNGFASFQTLLRLFGPALFVNKCRPFFLESLNS